VTDDSGALAVNKDGLDPDTVQLTTLQGTLGVSGIHPIDLYQVLSQESPSIWEFAPLRHPAISWLILCYPLISRHTEIFLDKLAFN
jgi:hypothetical protein